MLLAALIVRRWLDRAVARHRSARQKTMINAMARVVESPDPLQAVKKSGAWYFGDLSCDFAIKALDAVRRVNRGAMQEQLERLGLKKAIWRELDSGEPGLQLDAIGFLRKTGDRTFCDKLYVLAVRAEHQIRVAAISLLLDWGEVPSARWLMRALEIGEVRPSIEAEGLFRRLPPNDSFWRHQIDQTSASGGAKILGIHALAHRPEPQNIRAILHAAAHENADIRAQALRILGVLRAQEARPLLAAAFYDGSWFVVLQAAFCAGRLGAGEYLPNLERLLNHQKWWVRYRAAQALLSFGDVGLEILRAVSNQAGRAGRAASIALSEKGVR
jgi:HEAT repeat protein